MIFLIDYVIYIVASFFLSFRGTMHYALCNTKKRTLSSSPYVKSARGQFPLSYCIQNQRLSKSLQTSPYHFVLVLNVPLLTILYLCSVLFFNISNLFFNAFFSQYLHTLKKMKFTALTNKTFITSQTPIKVTT